MATATAPASGMEVLRQEITALEGEISNLKTKLAGEQKDLDSLETERGQIAEAIALGSQETSKASGIARKIEQAQARVAGFQSLIAGKQTRLDTLWPELRRIEAENLLAKRRAEAQTLAENGAEIVATINSKLRSILIEDFPALDAIRDRLAANELRQLGGAEVALQLIRNLTDAKGVLFEENKLTDGSMHRPASYDVRGDIHLTVRNLRKS